ncbi:MAG: hypothetical protein JW803_00280 [Endomicrobiales bacterium]|nr:hypothetical protein [Endomicrobiales bacterium]
MKTVVKIRLIFTLFLIFAVVRGSGAAPIFTGTEKTLEIKPTTQNYYIATLTGEAEFYDPTFYDDYMLTIDGKPVLHFTRLYGEPVDFFYYVSSEDDLKFVSGFFQKHKGELDKMSKRIFVSLDAFRETEPSYSAEGLHSRTAGIIEKMTNVTIEQIMSKKSLKKISEALYNYLKSNGIEKLEQLYDNPKMADMIVNKFYMLNTTSFYREWAKIKEFKPYLEPIKRDMAEEKRIFKAKVFACSTGEEVFTYAVELLESGINDFTILASDINDPSLVFAAKMKYPNASFSNLPFEIQGRLKKHFVYEKEGNLWEPKDPEFFKKRIKFINHDLLNALPGDIEERFAPPYDLISILNVLFYLEDGAIQKRKDYWKKLLRPGGILVLHDTKNSILAKRFGVEWGFKNFLIVNEWVNIRLDGKMNSKEKIEHYRNAYLKDPSETNLVILDFAYNALGKNRESASAIENYVLEHEYSINAHNMLLSNYNKLKDVPKTQELVFKLATHFVTPDLIIANLVVVSDKEDKPFLEELAKRSRDFMSGYRTDPERAEKIFDFDGPASEKWGPLKMLFKMNALNLLKEFYRSEKSFKKYEAVSLEGLELAARFARAGADSFPISSRYIDLFTDGFVNYCIEKGEFGKATEFLNKAEEALLLYGDKDMFDVSFGLGNAYLNEAVIREKRGKLDTKTDTLEKSVANYRKALEHVNMADLYTVLTLYGKISKSYYLKAKNYLNEKDKKNALAYLKNAFEYLEKGMEISSVYSKTLIKQRGELLDIAKKHGLLRAITPEE